MKGVIDRALMWLDDFLRDGSNGERSSSRLIALFAALVMASYVVADVISRAFGGLGMNENVAITCVITLGSLGGVAYGVNKAAGIAKTKKETDKDDP